MRVAGIWPAARHLPVEVTSTAAHIPKDDQRGVARHYPFIVAQVNSHRYQRRVGAGRSPAPLSMAGSIGQDDRELIFTSATSEGADVQLLLTHYVVMA